MKLSLWNRGIDQVRRPSAAKAMPFRDAVWMQVQRCEPAAQKQVLRCAQDDKFLVVSLSVLADDASAEASHA